MFDPVPWFVGGGAEHSPEVARLLAYVAAGDRAGVVSPGDCKVFAMDVPSNQARVAGGAVAVPNRAPSSGQQTYLMRNAGDAFVTLTETSSAGPRTDLIYVIVEDPQYPGNPSPADPATGPYCRVAVLEGVPAATRQLADVDATLTGYALALVTRPASTGIVEAGHITDLRGLLAPRTYTEVLTAIGPAAAQQFPSPQAVWPSTAKWSLRIPEWASRVSVIANLEGVSVAAAGTGVLHVYYRDGSANLANINIRETGPAARGFTMGGQTTIPAAYRGTVQNVSFQGRRDSGSNFMSASSASTAFAAITFHEDVA